MANTGYGYTTETQKMSDVKYDPELMRQARDWIEDVLGGTFFSSPSEDIEIAAQQFHKVLKDGTVLCKLAQQAIGPESIEKIIVSANDFRMAENVSNFLTAAELYGVNRGDLFQSGTLHKGENLTSVIGGIHAFARKAQENGFDGPLLGPKEAGNVVEFDEETLMAGRADL